MLFNCQLFNKLHAFFRTIQPCVQKRQMRNGVKYNFPGENQFSF